MENLTPLQHCAHELRANFKRAEAEKQKYQLDKLESTHTFARAVFYGQNGQIPYAGKEEQQVADACKQLVQNTIVCWNCLYLNQYLFQAPTAERQAVADAIAASSPPDITKSPTDTTSSTQTSRKRWSIPS